MDQRELNTRLHLLLAQVDNELREVIDDKFDDLEVAPYLRGKKAAYCKVIRLIKGIDQSQKS